MKRSDNEEVLSPALVLRPIRVSGTIFCMFKEKPPVLNQITWVLDLSNS